MRELARFGGLFLTMTVVFSGCSCDDDPEGSGGDPGTDSVGSTSGTTGGGGDGGSGGAGGAGVGGAGFVCETPDEGTVFALTELRFGTEQLSGWKKVGMNIDGLVSDGSSTDHCQPNSSANPNVAYADGDDGIDNAFGRSLLPLIVAVVPSFVENVNTHLDQGTFNAMLKAYCLDETGNGPLVSKVFGGTDLGYDPFYTGIDVWPVAPELLSDPRDPESSSLVFENSSVVGDAYDSGPNEDFVLFIPIETNGMSTSIKLSLHSARLTMTLSEDRKSATGGVLAGVLDTEEVVDQAKKVLWVADRCDDENYDNIITAIRQASDIMNDGTQDPSATCNGISFGVEFDMSEVQLGDVGPYWPAGMACP